MEGGKGGQGRKPNGGVLLGEQQLPAPAQLPKGSPQQLSHTHPCPEGAPLPLEGLQRQ